MTVIHGFELIREQDIPEMRTKAQIFHHVKTGAELVSLQNDDENKVFCITFRTPPVASNGVAHIMEHSVLCGSHKYPVKEPFVELIKGSLKTFVNAFTYPDKTCYPAASQNKQDFYNLIDVYLDAVFYPLIPPEVLQQEGWHYELDDPSGPLAYKGVVFNEMKGVYSNPDDLLQQYRQTSLYPDTPYGVDSGGDPKVIPSLTYEQFKDFHQRYYHPSNARIWFYGDDDPEERLRILDNYLKDFEPLPVSSDIPLQPAFSQPKSFTFPYDPGEDAGGKRGMLAVNWTFPDLTGQPADSLGLHILTYILIGTPASPLRKALIDSGLGEDLIAGGLEGDLRQMYFSTGLKGMAVEDAEKVEKLILRTLDELAHFGLDPDSIAAAVNTTEFRLRENNTGSFPRGLALALRSLTSWLYDGDPLAPLAFEAPLRQIKAQLEAGQRYFENLIKRYLLENNHRTTVLMQPKPGLAQAEEAAERERMDGLKAAMSPAELQAVIENTRRLKALQEAPNSPEALATIPSLQLGDLDRKIRTIPLAIEDLEGNQVFYHDLFTNGIVYLDLGLDLHTLPPDLLPYVELFGRALLETGTEKEDFVKLSQRIGRSTGGIHPAVLTTPVIGAGRSVARLFLRGKATVAQTGELLAILRDVLTTARLDNRERFRQIVLEEKADQEARLVPAGFMVVNSRLRARFDEADWVGEQISGVSYLYFLRQLAERVENDWNVVHDQLEHMRRLLVNRLSLLTNVTVDAGAWQQVRPQLGDFLASLQSSPPRPAQWPQPQPAPGEGLAIPAQVNYVGKGANLYTLGYQLDGSIQVILNYLRTTWMWEKVRVQGGAYGGYVSFDHRSGVLTFLSYRDPNLLLTLRNYDESARFLKDLEISPDELVKSIIGTIGDLDAYQLPDAKGFTSMVRYLAGDDDESRQHRRDQVLATTPADFHAFGAVLEKMRDQAQVVVLGSPEALQAANQERPGLLEIHKLL